MTTYAAIVGKASEVMEAENGLWLEVGEICRLARELPRALREERERTTAAVAGWVRALCEKRDSDRRYFALARAQRREMATMERLHRIAMVELSDECERLRGAVRVLEDTRAAEARQGATEIALARARFDERSAQLAISTRQVDQLKRQIAVASTASLGLGGGASGGVPSKNQITAGTNQNKRRHEEGGGEASTSRPPNNTADAADRGPTNGPTGKGKGKGKGKQGKS